MRAREREKGRDRDKRTSCSQLAHDGHCGGRGGGDHEHAGQHAHPPLAPQTHVSHEVNEGQRGGEEHGEPRHPRERDGEDGQHLCVRGSCLFVCGWVVRGGVCGV